MLEKLSDPQKRINEINELRRQRVLDLLSISAHIVSNDYETLNLKRL